MVKIRKQKIPNENKKKSTNTKKADNPINEDPEYNQLILTKLISKRVIKIQFPFLIGRCGKRRLGHAIPNKDKKYYTPMFHLVDDGNAYQQKQHEKIHKERLQAEVTEIDVKNIQIAKPSSRNSYCTICKFRFEDYLEHIRLDSHFIGLKSSPFNEDIRQLCEKYPGKNNKIENQQYETKITQICPEYEHIQPFYEIQSNGHRQFNKQENIDDSSMLYNRWKQYHHKDHQKKSDIFDVVNFND